MSDVKLIAFYLPQFHPIPENDAWWGEGFTEWSNVRRARPNFVGHYQPHVAGELGYYDLSSPETRAAQAELARAHGIYGFCYYYYWFNGRRLLHRPLDEVVQSGEPDFPFCVCWANENWTRRWDGGNDEVLLAQSYTVDEERRFIDELLPLFADRRYIRVGDRPLLLVYRPGLLPDPARAFATYRDAARQAGCGELYLACVAHPDTAAPEAWGFDATVEFPPHGLRAETLTDQVRKTNPAFAGTVWDYISAAQQALSRPQPAHRQLRGVMTAWDNTPRLQNNGQIFVNSHPQNYGRWLAGVVAHARRAQDLAERIVFINAWNEWGEGCYLEPDAQFGRGYLEATRAALGLPAPVTAAAETQRPDGPAASPQRLVPSDVPLFADTIVQAVVGNGLIANEQAALVKARGDKPLLVIAGAPKSGSTFLAHTLSALTGLQRFRLCAAYATNEHDLYLPAMCLMSAYGCVSQLHMKGTFHNAALMRSFGIKPIVLVRRIEDIVLSLQHDLKRKSLSPLSATGEDGYAFIWQDQCTQDMSDEQRLDLIIDLALPWFVNFYVSWYRLCEQGAVDALWITYEQLFAEKEATLRQVLAFLGFADIGAIAPSLLSRTYDTFRDGRVGQGSAALSARQQAKVRALFAHYPGVDFSKYGIVGSA
ncbi:MAG TPA: glycoside hydrolase family 99-like domain-containing protein [Casimicrobiaceae bacterium]|nr:glycoside hydrolase family 99-like domain-containing protein [Casimicrobiaceae bacterium]